MSLPLRKRARRGFTLLTLGLLSCSTTESGVINLITGGETGSDSPFAEQPLPTELAVTATDIEGGTTDLIRTAYQAGATLTLPQLSSDNVDTLRATAYDSADAAIIYGQTIVPIQLGGIDGITLDLFVQRKGQFARMPSPVTPAIQSPLATIVDQQFIFVADTKAQQGWLYSLLFWALAEAVDGGPTSTPLPCPPLTVAAISGTTYALFICSEKSTSISGACQGETAPPDDVDLHAYLYDVSGQPDSCETFAPGSGVDAGSPFSWTSLAGGSAVTAPNGDVYIVGATRPAMGASGASGPTESVLRYAAPSLNDAGIAQFPRNWFALNTPRAGAAALWLTRSTGAAGARGLVVAGGNQPGDKVGGVEYLASGSVDAGQAFTLTAYPTDFTAGAGGAMVDETHLLLAGGTAQGGAAAPVRLLDLTCMSSCMAQTGGTTGDGGADGGGHDGGPREGGPGDAGATASIPLATAQGFSWPGDAAPLFVGPSTSKGGVTRAFRVGVPSTSTAAFAVSEVPLRVPARTGTTAIQTAIPSVVVIGGDTTMESFIP